ncbi:DinB family protein [Niabella aquatica]
MKLPTIQLLGDLKAITQRHCEILQHLQSMPDADLEHRPHAQGWNALECTEHLNRYAAFYHPEIEKRINQAGTKPDTIFKSGWLGNYFAKMMWPKERLNKMKTFRSMNPAHEHINRQTLTKFESRLQQLLQLLDQAATINLNKTRTSISISPFIKLKIGDTFRVVIYHNERHLQQALEAAGNLSGSFKQMLFQYSVQNNKREYSHD